MVDGARGFRLRNSSFRRIVQRSEGVKITANMASRDLRAMVEADVLVPKGEKRGRISVAGPRLQEVAWQQVRRLRPKGARQPGAVDERAGQGRLPGR